MKAKVPRSFYVHPSNGATKTCLKLNRWPMGYNRLIIVVKKILIIVLCAVSITLTGCIGMGSLNHNSVNQTEVVLQKNNFKVVKNVQGSTHSWYLFGIGGNSKQTLRDNAANEMFRAAELKNGQAVVNITYTTSTRVIMGVYIETTVTAYGTVIEFTD